MHASGCDAEDDYVSEGESDRERQRERERESGINSERERERERQSESEREKKTETRVRKGPQRRGERRLTYVHAIGCTRSRAARPVRLRKACWPVNCCGWGTVRNGS